MDWFDGNVVSRSSVGALERLFLDVPATVRASFAHPGQYLHLKTKGLEGPFAIASAPHASGPLELLFKKGTPLTDALSTVTVGQTLQLSKAFGPGFPLEKAQGHPLLLVASGTGQAPMRSVIESVRQRRDDFDRVTLLLGVRGLDSLAFESEHPSWEADRIDVHVTLSKSQQTWTGRTGWVQQHLPKEGLDDTLAFLVGQPAMVDAVKAALTQRGMPPSHVFLNL